MSLFPFAAISAPAAVTRRWVLALSKTHDAVGWNGHIAQLADLKGDSLNSQRPIGLQGCQRETETLYGCKDAGLWYAGPAGRDRSGPRKYDALCGQHSSSGPRPVPSRSLAMNLEADELINNAAVRKTRNSIGTHMTKIHNEPARRAHRMGIPDGTQTSARWATSEVYDNIGGRSLCGAALKNSKLSVGRVFYGADLPRDELSGTYMPSKRQTCRKADPAMVELASA